MDSTEEVHSAGDGTYTSAVRARILVSRLDILSERTRSNLIA